MAQAPLMGARRASSGCVEWLSAFLNTLNVGSLRLALGSVRRRTVFAQSQLGTFARQLSLSAASREHRSSTLDPLVVYEYVLHTSTNTRARFWIINALMIIIHHLES